MAWKKNWWKKGFGALFQKEFWNDYYNNGIIPNLWKGATGQESADLQNEANIEMQRETNALNADLTRETNEQNYDIAMQNLDFQQQNLDYQKELQKQIFEREDTALQRQAQDASALGINPLSLVGGSGANAGSVVSTSPLNNNYEQIAPEMVAPQNQVQVAGSALDAIAPVLGIIDSARSLEGHNLALDEQRANLQRKNLENMVYAHENGIDISKMEFIPNYTPHRNKEFQDLDIEDKSEETRNKKATANRNEREDRFQSRYGSHDNATDAMKAATDVAYQTERAIMYGAGDPLSDYYKPEEAVINSASKVASKATKNVLGELWQGMIHPIKTWKNYAKSKKNKKSS